MAQIRINTIEIESIINILSSVTKGGVAEEAIRQLDTLSKSDEWEKVGKEYGDDQAKKIRNRLKKLRMSTHLLLRYLEDMKDAYESLEKENSGVFAMIMPGMHVILGQKPITWEMQQMIRENNSVKMFISRYVVGFLRVIGSAMRVIQPIDVDLIEFESKTELLYGKNKESEVLRVVPFPFLPDIFPRPVPRRHPPIPVGPIDRWLRNCPWRYWGMIECIRIIHPIPFYPPQKRPLLYASDDHFRDSFLTELIAPALNRVAGGEDISSQDNTEDLMHLVTDLDKDIKFETESSMTAEKAGNLLSQGKQISFTGENFSLHRENGSLFSEGAFNGCSMNVLAAVNGKLVVSAMGERLTLNPGQTELGGMSTSMQFTIFSV